MTARPIKSLPDDVLRRKARPVTRFDDQLQTLIDDMVETMRFAPGVGLAAPQVNASQRVIVVEYTENREGDENKPPKLYVMVNPQITRASTEVEVSEEGCLSVPGLAGEVERPLTVTVKGLNRHGQPMRLKPSGWLARIFQHEIDHLDGILFTDRAMRIWQPEEPFPDKV